MSPTPGRRVTLAVALLAMFLATPRAPAQNAWQGEGLGRAEEKAKNAEAEKARAAAATLSPNRIVGRVVWADAAKPLGVVRLDLAPSPAGATLIARSADCTPRAVLEPVPTTGRRTATVGYRVTHGTLAAGLEVVQPGEKLLKESTRKLAPVKPAATPPTAAPEAKTKPAAKPPV